MRGGYREAGEIGRSYGSGSDELGGRTLGICHVALADLLADGDDDTLPSDHGAKAERDGDRDLHPERDELGGVVERALVGAQGSTLILGQVVLLVLQQEADRFGREIHVVAGIGHGLRGYALERSVLV